MIHISEFRIHRFRGLRDLTLAGLGDFNLLVGPNNCGKSSILEAFACHANPLNIEEWLSIGWWREIKSARTSVDYSMAKLFPQPHIESDKDLESGWIALDSVSAAGTSASLAIYNEQISIGRVLTSGDEDGRPVRLRQFSLGHRQGYRFDQMGLSNMEEREIPSTFLADFHMVRHAFEGRERIIDKVDKTASDLNYDYVGVATHRTAKETIDGISRAIGRNYRNQIIEVLRQIDATLTGIEILEFADQPINIFLRRGDDLSPITAFGDGIRRLIHIIGSAARSADGLLLIDELEIGLHPSAMTRVLPRLMDLCAAFNVQIIATTHSLEAIDAFLGERPAGAAGPTLYRLPGRAETPAKVRRFAWSDVQIMRAEYGMEIR